MDVLPCLLTELANLDMYLLELKFISKTYTKYLLSLFVS